MNSAGGVASQIGHGEDERAVAVNGLTMLP